MIKNKTLKNLLIGSSIFALSLFSSKLLSQDFSKIDFYSIFKNKSTIEQISDTLIINPHIQPNDSTYGYGSGDIDSNNVLNWDDNYDLENLINEVYPETNIRLRDRADINGDTIINYKDQKILKGFLEDSLDYLPAQWNKLLASERINWLEKIIEINKNTPINADMSNWTCANYSQQFIINTQGINGNVPDSIEYDFTHNRRFNLPVFELSLQNSSTDFYHEVIAILIGNNAKDFRNWYVIEPQTHKKYEPEKDPRMEGGNAYLNYVGINSTEYFYIPYPFLKFRIENQKATLATLDVSLCPVKLIETRDTSNLRTTPLYTSLEKQMIQRDMTQKFYPNPVSNMGIFEFKENPFEERKIEIYDIYGKKKFEKISSSDKIEINFASYPNGIYFYKINNKNKEISTGKIIKQ